MKRFILILLALIILISVTGCSEKKERFDYPENFTTQYCYENYSPLSLNYIYSSSYENGTISKFFGGGRRRTFRAIPDVDINSFLACEEIFGFGGKMASYDAILYKANNYEIDPLNDWEIENIEICLQKENVCMSKNESHIVSYGDYIYHSCINKTSDDMLIKQIVDCIKNEDEYIRYYDNDLNRFGEYVRFNEEDKSYYYSIRIHFEETDMILWTASIIMHDEHYYLMCRQNPKDYIYCIPLTEELEEFISSSIDTSN